MIKTISALILIALAIYAQLNKFLAKRRGNIMECANCGKAISERPVKKTIGGKEMFFCCEHCAFAYAASKDEAAGYKPPCCG